MIAEGWRLLVDPARSAAAHMALDEQLAQDAIPTLRLFVWNPPAVSLGFRQRQPEWLSMVRRRGGVQVVERPTGGGIAFHGSDVSCSVIVPHRLSVGPDTLLGIVCETAAKLCGTYGLQATAALDGPRTGRVTYCLTQPSPYAVLVGARKVAGFALRRFQRSWLIQGSLLVRPLPNALGLVVPRAIKNVLGVRAMALSDAIGAPVSEEEVAARWARQWPAWWEDILLRKISCAVHVS